MKYLFFLLSFLCATILMSADQPFEWSWQRNQNAFTVTVKISHGAYLYQKETKLEVKQDGKTIQAAKTPPFTTVKDPVLGKTNIYDSKTVHSWVFLLKNKTPVSVSLAWQGCGLSGTGDAPTCYIPQELSKELKAEVPSSGILYSSKQPDSEKKVSNGIKIERTAYGYVNADKFIAFLKGEHDGMSFAGKGILLVVVLSILGGIALNLTPCVLPMIPINLAIIGADSGNKKSSVIRGFVYAAGIAIAYGTLGVAVVLGGATFGALDSFWYFNLAAAVIFILLGLSLFDIFPIDFSRYGSNMKMPSTARLAGVFILGAVSALLAGACVAPVVIAVLIHSANLYAAGNPFGLFLPFTLGIGMGLPWPLIAAGIANIPKPGKWMVKIKYAFAVIIVLTGLYYGYLGISLLTVKTGSNVKAELHSPEAIDRALAASKEDGRPILIDFWAEWCKNCKAMDLTTMNDPKVKETLKAFHFVKLDATKISSPEIKAVMERFGVSGLPTYIILNPK